MLIQSPIIPTLLTTLRTDAPPHGRVLSVYLATPPRLVTSHDYLLVFRDQCNELREHLTPREHDQFEAAVAQCERYLTDRFSPHHAGLALFADGTADYFFVADLPLSPDIVAAWGERPLLAPLEAIVNEAERVAVVLFDKEQTRLFTIVLGQVEEHQMFVDDVPGKQATGGWFALAQTRYARHHEEHVRRHARRTIQALLAVLRQHPFDHLLLAGPDEAIALLKDQLPSVLRTRLGGLLTLELFATDAEVVAAATKAARALHDQADLALVDQLIDRPANRSVALGFDETLAALGESRVHRLLLADTFIGSGGACPRCERLVAGPGPCPICGAVPLPVESLGERIIDQALAQGAQVDIVTGPAARTLMLHGGLGAWTRY